MPHTAPFIIDPQQVSLAILAGGAGVRLGGVDKAWLDDGQGHALVERLIVQLQSQSSAQIIIVANRHFPKYSALGHIVVRDKSAEHQGPLAGVIAALQACTSTWLAIVPVDAWLLPPDLLLQLRKSVKTSTQLAMLGSSSGLMPVIALLPRVALSHLEHQFDHGERSLLRALKTYCNQDHNHALCTVDYSHWPEHFLSINTPEEYDFIKRFANTGK